MLGSRILAKALLLALIDLPDFSTPLSSIAGSVEKIADSSDGKPEEVSAIPEPGSAPAQLPKKAAIFFIERRPLSVVVVSRLWSDHSDEPEQGDQREHR